MPMYDYRCRYCNIEFSDIMLPIAQREQPTTEPCPVCNNAATVELCVSAPNIGDSVRIGRLNLPSSWTDKLSQIKSHHYGSTMHVPTPHKREA
jgi:putative FmdB family regulatory protein